MLVDNRNLPGVLKRELQFLERGGHRSWLTAAWRPQFIFENSPACLNFQRTKTKAPRPCRECVTLSLVPSECLDERFPCRHIASSDDGFTMDTYDGLGTCDEVEAAEGPGGAKRLRNWNRRPPHQTRIRFDRRRTCYAVCIRYSVSQSGH